MKKAAREKGQGTMLLQRKRRRICQTTTGASSKGTSKLLTGATGTCTYTCPDGHRQGRKWNGTVPSPSQTTTTMGNHGKCSNNTM